MGNRSSKTKQKKTITKNGVIKHPNIPIPKPCDPITHKEWISKIESERNKYRAKQNMTNKYDEMTDYELFINYLAFNKSVIGYSEICIAARIIRYYTGCVSGVSLFNEDSFTFSGIRISIAIHPITAQIFIADEQCIYQYHEQSKNKKQTFKAIAKTHNKMTKITDLCFSSDGERLFCLLDHNMCKVYYVIINENIAINARILYWREYDVMDCLKYDFNHFYLNSRFLPRMLDNDFNHSHSYNIIRSDYTLYTLDLCKKHLWIVCNSCTGRRGNESLNVEYQPLLMRIPSQFVLISRRIEELNKEIMKLNTKTVQLRLERGQHPPGFGNGSYDAAAQMDDEKSNQIEATNKFKEIKAKIEILEKEIQTLKLEKMKEQNRIELIDLYLLLRLKEIHQKANYKRRNEVHAAITVTAFDVDKFHGGVYIITSDKRFFRIEKCKRKKVDHSSFNDNDDEIGVGVKSDFERRMTQIVEDEKNMMNDIVGDVAIKECWFEKANAKYPNTFVNGQDEWNITHEAKLRDVLPNGVPLGICNVRYDSVTGRIIVADNYKIQALYF